MDVPYPAEYLPTPLGRSTLAQVAARTGGTLLAATDPHAITGDARSYRAALIVLALLLYAVSIGARLLPRVRIRPGGAPGPPEGAAGTASESRPEAVTPR
jgi:hypothetical protein